MEIKIEGGYIHIKAKINEPLEPSKTGKSLNLFTSGGIQPTTVQYKGKVVKVGVNIFIDNK